MSTTGAISAAGAAGRALPPPGLPRLIPAGGPLTLRDHVGRYGPVPFRDAGGRGHRARAADLIAEVERAGLTGRGGANFPTGRKMRTVAEDGGPGRCAARAARSWWRTGRSPSPPAPRTGCC